MVNGERVLDGLGLGDRPLPLGRIERRFDQGGNTAESETPPNEFSHRYLVCGVEDRRGGPTGRKRPAGQSQRRKTLQIGLFERQRGDTRKIEPGGGRRHAYRPSQAMGDRNAHVGRAELGDDGAVTVFHQAMNHGLRVDDDVEGIRSERE